MTLWALLDTDVASYLMKGSPLAGKFRPALEGKAACLSFVSIGELYRGAYEARWGAKRLESLDSFVGSLHVLPFRAEIPMAYALVMAQSKLAGRQMSASVNDAWIAATALAYQLPLLANNRRHFEHVPGLALL